jgi:hypothetical protein
MIPIFTFSMVEIIIPKKKPENKTKYIDYVMIDVQIDYFREAEYASNQ